MLTKRIIPCLDVEKGKVVKGIKFKNLRVEGDPVELAEIYDKQGADELVFLDVTASYERRDILLDVVKRTAEKVFIPFTVGGGIKSLRDIKRILSSGADKISINTFAVRKPHLIKKAAEIFGSQCIVIAIDAKRNYDELDKPGIRIVETPQGKCWWEVYIEGGRTRTGIDAIEWAKKVEELGAGEILLTSMDCDGTRSGYDIPLTRTICETVNIPVIASGGAGKPEHILEVLTKGGADAALAASIFHEGEYSIFEVKKFLKSHGILIRLE